MKEIIHEITELNGDKDGNILVLEPYLRGVQGVLSGCCCPGRAHQFGPCRHCPGEEREEKEAAQS
jgi:hypothetical protein